MEASSRSIILFLLHIEVWQSIDQHSFLQENQNLAGIFLIFQLHDY